MIASHHSERITELRAEIEKLTKERTETAVEYEARMDAIQHAFRGEQTGRNAAIERLATAEAEVEKLRAELTEAKAAHADCGMVWGRDVMAMAHERNMALHVVDAARSLVGDLGLDRESPLRVALDNLDADTKQRRQEKE